MMILKFNMPKGEVHQKLKEVFSTNKLKKVKLMHELANNGGFLMETSWSFWEWGENIEISITELPDNVTRVNIESRTFRYTWGGLHYRNEEYFYNLISQHIEPVKGKW